MSLNLGGLPLDLGRLVTTSEHDLAKIGYYTALAPALLSVVHTPSINLSLL